MPDLILNEDLISQDNRATSVNTGHPYWNEKCFRKQLSLWLPSEDESGISNFYVDKVNYWKTVLSPKVVEPKHTSVFSLISPVKKQREICFMQTYPENIDILNSYINISRKAYNLAISILKDGYQYKLKDVHRTVKERMKKYCEHHQKKYGTRTSDTIREAVHCALNIVKMKRCEASSEDYYAPIAKTQRTQWFIFKKMHKTMLGHLNASDCLINKNVLVTRKGKDWFISSVDLLNRRTTKHTVTESVDVTMNNLKVCAIDPGVKTFATAYSADRVVQYGNEFCNDILYPMCLELDELLLGENEYFRHHHEHNDQVEYAGKIKHLTSYIESVVEYMHINIIRDLFTYCDVVLIPDFTLGASVLISNLSSKTARSLFNLYPCKLKEMLFKYAETHDKKVLTCSENYTTTTVSWNGKTWKHDVEDRAITSEGKTVLRDVNGARGILLRALSL